VTKSVSFQGCKDGSTYVNPSNNTTYKQKGGQMVHDSFIELRKKSLTKSNTLS
jgi:hypothetical protein